MRKRKKDCYLQEVNSDPRIGLGIILILIALICVLGAALIGEYWKNETAWPSIVISILTSIASIVGISAFWELFAKIKFAEKVISLANISTNLQVSGVVKYTNNFEEEINWREELSYTKQISIVFTYGATWRVHNRKALKDFLEDGGEIKVFLPNPDNKSNMDILDQRFNYESGKTAEKIREAIKFFISLKNESLNNKLELKLYKYTFQNSYYIMDNYAIMAPFNHLIKQGEVPALKGVKNGALYDFIKKEIEAIEYQSDPYSEVKNDK